MNADQVTLHHGDCLDVLRTLPDASVDSVVTDPPYGLEFMGKDWDAPWKAEGTVLTDPAEVGGFQDGNGGNPYSRSRVRFGIGVGFQQWCEEWAAECLRVLKPGGHLLAFGGTRTWHRLACAVEDAGFEVRDSIAWMYGSGFPKSLDVSKAIDKAAGAEREVVGHEPSRFTVPKSGMMTRSGRAEAGYRPADGPPSVMERNADEAGYRLTPITAPATPDAERWQGWGTALKPAFEPVVVARKPLTGTVAANVLAHGTGALNIDGCRVEHDAQSAAWVEKWAGHDGHPEQPGWGTLGQKFGGSPAGRWPANVVLDESQAAALDQMSGEVRASGHTNPSTGRDGTAEIGPVGIKRGHAEPGVNTYSDHGGASRFFYIAREDNEPCTEETTAHSMNSATDAADDQKSTTPRTLEAGESPTSTPTTPTTLPIDQMAERFTYVAKADASERPRINGTSHPTVKPLALMRWLVRLVTPPGGTVLEPFAGSGTTVEACLLEGFRCIAIEREADYLPLIEARLARRLDPVRAIELAGDDGGLFDLLDDGPAA